jgi:hypothetical protein
MDITKKITQKYLKMSNMDITKKHNTESSSLYISVLCFLVMSMLLIFKYFCVIFLVLSMLLIFKYFCVMLFFGDVHVANTEIYKDEQHGHHQKIT